MSWKDDKRWADRFIPRMKEILGRELIEEASASEDQFEATDFKVLVVKPYKFAYRARRYATWHAMEWPKHKQRSSVPPWYPHDVTIRKSRPKSSNKTEYEKIFVDGLCDFYFFGWETEDGALGRWVIIDLHHLRMANDKTVRPHAEMPNPGGESTFVCYGVHALAKSQTVVAFSPRLFEPFDRCGCPSCIVHVGVAAE